MQNTINHRTLQLLREHGPMNAERFAKVAEPTGSVPSMRLLNAMRAGIIVRSLPPGAHCWVYAAPEEGPLLVALRDLQAEHEEAVAAYYATAHEEGALQAEMAALTMRLHQLQTVKAQQHETKERLLRGINGLAVAVYRPLNDAAPAPVAPQPVKTASAPIPFQRRPVNSDPRLAIFDDPAAYPQVQEG